MPNTSIYFSKKQYEWLKEKAKGKSTSAYIRECIQRANDSHEQAMPERIEGLEALTQNLDNRLRELEELAHR